MTDYSLLPPHRLRLDTAALLSNYRWLAEQSGPARCGAAVKADAYGLGARGVVEHLQKAGCRDFFVATWAEAAALADLLASTSSLSVLHGVRDCDLELAISRPNLRPVLVSANQVARWKTHAPGRPADVMVDTGMNRLGLSPQEALSGLLDGLPIATLLSHLASADEDGEQNAQQLARFAAVAEKLPAATYSLANSPGVLLGKAYHFGLTRPGLALYGGLPRGEGRGHLQQVVYPEAQVIQLRELGPGDTVGYNATWRCDAPQRAAVVNLGYADGYLRAFSGCVGQARFDGAELPVLGRVSMDLIVLGVPQGCEITDGDFVTFDYDLSHASAATGISQYELLTNLGQRFHRYWI